MTNIPFIPETAPFSTEQRAWLNGFLAGLFASGAAPQTPPSAQVTAPPGLPLLLLFGSQTGTAEALAQKCASLARQHGFEPRVSSLNECRPEELIACQIVVIISSTWGDGDPPDNAVSFWAWLKSESAPRLEKLRFAVLGLGDRNYPDFCGASRKFDARLEQLGAIRLVGLGECDVDYEGVAAQWLDCLWSRLKSAPPEGTATLRDVPDPVNRAHPGAGAPSVAQTTSSRHGKHNPFPARLLRNLLLNKPGSAKEVRHYELDLRGSDLSYQAGDALGIFPVNCPELVDRFVGVLGCSPEMPVSLSGATMPIHEALSRHLDMTKPSLELIAAVAAAAPETELGRLHGEGKTEELKTWLFGRAVIDLLCLLPSPFAVPECVSLLRKLAPRLYSISSSPKAHPEAVHLTVSSVRYHSHGAQRKGVASTFLADRVGESEVIKLFVQPSHFRPPASGDTGMIMVGPGTGIAPFRAFLQERQATGACGKNWLFFGDQTRAADFLYESQLTAWQKQALLTRLDLAFSRDQARKVYVQHLMLDNAAELWAWLDQGAHFYVCGDATRMAKDVDEALHRIVETAGGKTPEEAKSFVSQLKKEKRYQRDVY
jgi:sulfite reductase (NADPH) flavoprotein alpha-component